MLSEKQRKILRCIQLDADLPISRVAAITGCRSQTVQRCIRGFEACGAIRRTAAINLSTLGFASYNLLFSVSADSGSMRKSLIEELINHQNVGYVAEVGGGYQYEVSFAVRSITQLSAFLDFISVQSGNGLINRKLVVTTGRALFGTKSLGNLNNSRKSLVVNIDNDIVEFDERDHALLYVLANGSQRSRTAIARQVGMPLSTLNYRISALEQNQVIGGYYYEFRNEEFGSMKFKLLVFARQLKPDVRAAFFDFCSNHPNIDAMISCVGGHDYELVVQANSYKQLADLVNETQTRFGVNLSGLDVLPVIAVHKFTEYPFRCYEAAYLGVSGQRELSSFDATSSE